MKGVMLVRGLLAIMLLLALGAFLTRTLLFYIAGIAKPFQVSRPKAVVYFRN